MVRNTICFYGEELLVFSIVLLPLPFWPKREEVTGEWRKLYNEKLNDLYCSPNIVRVIKSRRMRWAGHAALWGREEVYTGLWWGNLRERDHLEQPGVDGTMDLQEVDVGAWTGLIWLSTGTGGGHL